MNLTEHQEEKSNIGLKVIKNGNQRLLVRGSAGVGKTYMVDALVQELAETFVGRKSIICSAPTHKAVSVLKDKVGERENLDFLTIHATLKLKKNTNRRTGAITYTPKYSEMNPPLQNIKLLIIDEASMISKEILGFIEEHASRNRTTVIFVGDDKQLNPVKEEDSPVFMANYPEVELTEIIRQGKGNPIIELSRNLRFIKSKINSMIDGKGYVFTNNKQKAIAELADVNGTDEFKYLSWTNKDVNDTNQKVREAIYGTPNKIEEGETLFFNAPFGDYTNGMYYTNEEIAVETISVKEGSFIIPHNNRKVFDPLTGEDEPMFREATFKYYSINAIQNSEGVELDDVIVIHEDSEKAFKKYAEEVKSRCIYKFVDWVDYYKFLESFADLSYNHAITVHKSQGSTYKNVVINVKNLRLNKNLKESERLMYTAITRASDLVILLEN